MAYILNIESATSICSIAISKNGQLLSCIEEDSNTHASRITLMIEEALQTARIKIKDIAAVAISNGPGSYTSLRVGTSTAKGICYALDIPMIAIDTLSTLAMAAYRDTNDATALYCPMIDARRMEVYSTIFSINTEGGIEMIVPLNNVILEENTFDTFIEQKKIIYLSGSGAEKCKTFFNSMWIKYVDNLCSARYMIPLSTQALLNRDFVDIAYHTPQYLKSPNITTPKAKV